MIQMFSTRRFAVLHLNGNVTETYGWVAGAQRDHPV